MGNDKRRREGVVGILFWYKVWIRKDWGFFVYLMGGGVLFFLEFFYFFYEFGFVGIRYFINFCKKKKDNLINSYFYIIIKY